MATFSYDHIHFRSEDPHAARTFWEEAFGAKVVQERELGGAPSFTFDLNGMCFLVSGRAQGEDPVKGGTDPRYGLDHFGLLVDNLDEAATELRGAVRAGLPGAGGARRQHAARPRDRGEALPGHPV